MAKVADQNELPLHRYKKQDIVWMAKHKCRHGHNYLSHPQCYINDNPKTHERLGFLDIETSNLAADFGIILSYCIKDGDSKKIFERVITKDEIESVEAGTEDTGVVKQLVQDIKQFDRLITFYGSKFDIPYIRTRAVVDNVPFPGFGEILHTDAYYIMKHRFKLSSNRLENSNRVLLGKTDKTRVDSKYWRGGVRGEAKSLQYILDHNRKDVLDLEKLWHRINKYVASNRRSM